MGEPFYTGNEVCGRSVSTGASSQEGYEPQQNPKVDWKIWHTIIGCEGDVLPQVAHFVLPSPLG